MKQVPVISGLLLACVAPCWAQAPTQPTLEELEKRAAILRPKPEEQKWLQIPWLVDLAEGMRLAKEENRPIFLWATTDEPLDRC